MNTIIADSVGVHDVTWRRSLENHKQSLLNTLQQATTQATQLQRSVLASCTWPIEHYDTIHAFTGSRLAGLGECFFWEQPVAQNALVGVGAATTIETTGTTSFTDAATTWRALMQDAVVSHIQNSSQAYGSGPVFFGGFAFDPLHPHTQLWEGFPDGLLVLPLFLLSYSQDSVSLTINRIMHAEDEVEQCAQEINSDAVRLFTAIENVSSLPQSRIDDETQGALSIQDLRPASDWMRQVAETANEIRQGTYDKVVLARGIHVTPAHSENTFDIAVTLNRLRQSYPSAYIFAIQRGERFFVGATPERLVQAQNGQIHTMALAGSAPRGASEEEDEQIGLALLQSEKNNIEHAIVAAKVREALLTHCSTVQVSHRPQLLKLKNVQHLETPIVGELLPGRCILDVMADLHPTPAVGGFPRQAALEAIRHVEQLDRGWYAGPLGWIGAGGHGEFAVALRSGLVADKKATLFAGCGIVADSDPQSEYAESCLKLQVMLRSLSGKM